MLYSHKSKIYFQINPRKKKITISTKHYLYLSSSLQAHLAVVTDDKGGWGRPAAVVGRCVDVYGGGFLVGWVVEYHISFKIILTIILIPKWNVGSQCTTTPPTTTMPPSHMLPSRKTLTCVCSFDSVKKIKGWVDGDGVVYDYRSRYRVFILLFWYGRSWSLLFRN